VPDSASCPGRCETRIAYKLDPKFSEEERGLVHEGMKVWEKGTGGRVCFAEGGDDVEFIRLEKQSELKPIDDEWPNHVALCKSGKIWIVASKMETHGEYIGVVVHELGHHLGLRHIEDVQATYMHSTINDTPRELWTDPQLPERDRREFCAIHGCTCAW
jgi:hypothetical protein